VRGGLAGFRLAHAESAAQAAMPRGLPAAARPNPGLPQHMRCWAATIMVGVSNDLPLPAAHALARRDLVGALLQVGWSTLGDRLLACAACS
jgi:hypothetical protein